MTRRGKSHKFEGRDKKEGFFGDFELLGELGRGGMGVVYKARQKSLGRLVALKVVKEDKGSHLQRFKREILVCARLSHPNIVKIFSAEIEGDTLYYVMEYLDAVSLDDYIASQPGGRVPLRCFFPLAASMASAFSYIHSKGLVHRDIKPANIMITRQGVLKVMDFGLVKVDDDLKLTAEGKAIGTPRYMSPEMIRASGVDRRSDIFQMGVVFYEMLTGVYPFKGNDVVSLARSILFDEVEPPSALVPSLPSELDAVVARCMAKDVSRRFQSASELAEALERTARRLQVDATSLSAMDGVALASGGIPGERPARTAGRRRGRGRASDSVAVSRLSRPGRKRGAEEGREGSPLRILGAAVLLLALPVCIWWFWGRGPDKGGWNVSNLVFMPDVGGVMVRWESALPYRGRLLVGEEDGTSSMRVVEEVPRQAGGGISATGSCVHEVALDSLSSGSFYLVKVVYPDGSVSLPYRIPKGAVRDSLNVRWRVRYTGERRCELLVDAVLPCSLQVRFERGGRGRSVESKEAAHHAIELPLPVGRGGLKNVELLCRTRLHRERIRIGDIPPLPDVLEKFCTEVEAFSVLEFLMPVREELRALGMKGRHDEARALLIGRCRRFPWCGTLESIRKVIPDFMRNCTRDGLALRRRLYGALRRLELIDQYLGSVRLKKVLDLSPLYSTYVRLSYLPGLPAAGLEPLFLMRSVEAGFIPRMFEQNEFFARVGRMKEGILKAYSGALRGTRHHESYEWVLKPSARLSKKQRLHFVMRVANLPPDYFFRVSVKGRGAERFFDVFNLYETFPGFTWNFGKSEVKDERKIQSIRVDLEPSFFPSYLLDGAAWKLKFRLYVIPGCTADNFGELRGVYLLHEGQPSPLSGR